MTKKEQIEALIRESKTTREIAVLTGTSRGYIRNVRSNVRHPGAQATADRKYRKTEHGRMMRKTWIGRHPDERARGRKAVVDAHQNITMPMAHNHRQAWSIAEIEYLEKNGGEKSIRQMALKLGRTYVAVLMAAHRFHVDLRGNKMGAESNKFKAIYAEMHADRNPAATN